MHFPTAGYPPVFAKVFILKTLQVLYFDALLQVFILKAVRAWNCCKMGHFYASVHFKCFAARQTVPTKNANQEIGVPGTDYTSTQYILYPRDM